jgi:hypothetical protein
VRVIATNGLAVLVTDDVGFVGASVLPDGRTLVLPVASLTAMSDWEPADGPVPAYAPKDLAERIEAMRRQRFPELSRPVAKVEDRGPVTIHRLELRPVPPNTGPVMGTVVYDEESGELALDRGAAAIMRRDRERVNDDDTFGSLLVEGGWSNGQIYLVET